MQGIFTYKYQWWRNGREAAMLEFVQFLPIFITVASGVIGIYLNVTDDKRLKFQYILLSLIILSGIVSGFLVYGKLISDEKAKAYESATNISYDKPFDYAIFVVHVSEADDDLARHVEFLIPKTTGQLTTAKVDVFGGGLESSSFALQPCGTALIVEEVKSTGSVETYFSSDYLDDQTAALACSQGVRPGKRGSPGDLGDNWIFDFVAGASGHVVNVNSGDNAGLVLRARQGGTVATIKLENLPNAAEYAEYVQRALAFELKFYQSLNAPNPIGESCQSVYTIPLKPSVAVNGSSLALITIDVADKGAFIECENNPI